MGSKSKIAEDILSFLPPGSRFVDLFGGGGSMTHCAMETSKWDSFLYNEINPVVCNLFRDATSGKFRDMHPVWISRDEFDRKKNEDGYIRLCWSFGNNGEDYIFGRNKEELKHSMFDFVVDGKKDETVRAIFGDEELEGDTWQKRYESYRKAIKEKESGIEGLHFLEMLGRIKRLQGLQNIDRIQNLESMKGLEITNMDYRDYEYREGDVVCCDPPYEGTDCKGYSGFDNKAFYDWVDSRPYRVFFSSYEISDRRFHRIWEQEKLCTIDCNSNSLVKVELLYTNEPYRTSLLPKQLELEL